MMNYDESVVSLCEEAIRLSKMESYRVFNRWKNDFEVKDTARPHKYTEKGLASDRLFKYHSGSDFHALFEYLNNRPVGYECIRLKEEITRLIYIHYILIGKDFSWSILFSHEDGQLIDGPFYFNKEGHPPDHR